MFGPLAGLKATILRHSIGAVAIATVASLAVGTGAGVVIEHQVTPTAATTAQSTATIPSLPQSPSGKKKATENPKKAAAMALLRLIEAQTGATAATIRADLSNGQTLAQICGGHEQAVVTAATTAVQKRLAAQVSAGTLTPAQEATRLQAFQKRLTALMAAPGKSVLAMVHGGGAGKRRASPSASPAPSGSAT